MDKDDRVRLSARGRDLYPQTKPDRLGTVVRRSIPGFNISVRWDGLKKTTDLHHTLLERVTQ